MSSDHTGKEAGNTSLDAIAQTAFAALVRATNQANSSFPSASHEFNLTFPSFRDETSRMGRKLLSITQTLMNLGKSCGLGQPPLLLIFSHS